MILQPASLDLATLKKKEQELGFFLMPNNHAIHQIAEIKYGSPAHGSSKIEEGDEIVQVIVTKFEKIFFKIIFEISR